MVGDLKSYKKLVRDRIKRNKDNSLWSQLDERWQLLTNHCRDVMAAWNSGRAQSGNDVRAAQELLKVAGHVDRRHVIETALCLYLLQDADPRRFRSDEAFLFQLVRRVRGLADVNAGEYYDHITGKQKRVYRDLPPRVTRVCGRLLNDVFGLPGYTFAKLERQDHEKVQKVRDQFAEALTSLR